MIDFQTDPTRYRHWKLSFDGPIATLSMDVDPNGGLMDGYELKLNSYDLGVDIELADAVQRLRFEHPEVKTVILRSARDGVFCAGANIRMLGRASHGHKVNFCKFTNETRLAIEDASENSGQTYLAAIAGTAAGGGYELAVTADHIMLIDEPARQPCRRADADRRPSLVCFSTGTSSARRPARHRGPDPPDRQAPRPPRQSGHFLHGGGGRTGETCRRLAPGGRDRPAFRLGIQGP